MIISHGLHVIHSNHIWIDKHMNVIINENTKTVLPDASKNQLLAYLIQYTIHCIIALYMQPSK